MTHFIYFDATNVALEDNIEAMEREILTVVDGMTSAYRCRVKRTGVFEPGKIGAVIEVSAKIAGRVVTNFTYYVIGS